jgi:hypothetical protein
MQQLDNSEAKALAAIEDAIVTGNQLYGIHWKY